jgi:hypothetical protein
MTRKFHEGQDVEVLLDAAEYGGGVSAWRKGIILRYSFDDPVRPSWLVQVNDGSRGVFDEAHIRVVPFQRPDRTDSGDFLYEPE